MTPYLLAIGRKTFAFAALIAIAAEASAMSFELNSNKIFLPVKVNNQGPYAFILDTGSESIVLDAERAKELGIPMRATSDSRGAGEGSLPAWIGKDIDVSTEGAVLRKQEIGVLPINKAISLSAGHRVDGLLGCPFFQRYVVEINYVQSQVTFHEPEKFEAGEGFESIPIEIERRSVFIGATLVLPNNERVAGRFFVDTGWRTALSLTAPFVREHKLLAATGTHAAMTGFGVGGSVMNRVGRVTALEIGPYTIQNPVTDFSEASGGILAQMDFTGMIGAEVLRRFHVIFDYPHRRLLLKPNPNFDEPYEFDMSGLFLVAEGKDFQPFKVLNVIPDSPADAAGIKVGDVIWAINNQAATKFTLDQVRQMFRQPEREYFLSIVRENKNVQIRLMTRRLI